MDTAVNIVFLDFDGPIVNHRASLSVREDSWGGGMSYLDPIACGLIKRLCEEHEAKIVVSSSWRADFNLLTMQSLLGGACPGLDRYVYPHQQHWRTNPSVWWSEGELEYGTDRGLEIKLWLSVNHGKWKNFVAIDDMADMRPVQNNLVKVDCYDGFGFHAYMKAKRILDGRDTDAYDATMMVLDN